MMPKIEREDDDGKVFDLVTFKTFTSSNLVQAT